MADLSITAASVVKGSDATTEVGIAGGSLTAGQTVYKDTSDSNKIKAADANASAATAVLAGIALHAASSGQPVVILTGGTWTVGATISLTTPLYVLSATAGGIAPSADLASGWYCAVVGVATSTSVMKYIGYSSGVAVP